MKAKPSWQWFELSLILLSLAIGLYIALSPTTSLLNWYPSDDAFYYFKVAVNVTTGHGLTFDGIDRTNGFHPLWMLVCIAIFWLARYNLILPLRMLVIVSVLFNCGTGILLFRLLRKFLNVYIAALTAVFWLFHPFIFSNVVTGGMETSINVFFLALLLYNAVRLKEKQPSLFKMLLLGLVAGLAVLARLDSIFVVALIGVWFLMGRSTAYLRNLVVGDLAIICLSGMLSYYLRLGAGGIYIQSAVSLPYLIGIGFIAKPLFLYLFGLYTPWGEPVSWKLVARYILAVTSATVVIGAGLFILQKINLFSSLPRSVIGIDWAITLLGLLVLRILARVVFINTGSSILKTSPATFSGPFLKEVIQRGVGYFIPLAILLGGYMLWSHFYIGSSSPVSGDIKHWWGTLPNPVYGQVTHSVSELFGVEKYKSAWELAFQPMYFIEKLTKTYLGPQYAPAAFSITEVLLLIIIIGIVLPLRRRVAQLVDNLGILALFAGLYAQIMSFTSTTYVSIQSWYWVNEILLTVICLGILLDCIYQDFQKINPRPEIVLIALALIDVGCIFFLLGGLWRHYPYNISPQQTHVYLTDPIVVEANTEPGAIIGMTGGGAESYFIHGRTIVNLDGLINSPEYFNLMEAGRGHILLDRIGMNYVLASKNMIMYSDPYMGMFSGRLQPVRMILPGWMLYRYNNNP